MIDQKLDRLSILRGQIAAHPDFVAQKREALEQERAQLLDRVLTPEILAQLQEINAEFAPKFAAIENDPVFDAVVAEAAALEEEIKRDVIKQGASVKGTFLHAIFVSGRVSWDSKGLDGFAVAHPEINNFRKVGEPSVTIRKVEK